jgi:glucose/mannose-6-phosphate isomerase
MAGQLMDRVICVVGSGGLEPVARYWKIQLNELTKVWASYDALPEMDHNSISGAMFPEESLSRLFTIFLRSPSDVSRNRYRSDLTRQVFMLNGLSTDFIDAQGEGPMAQQWTCLHFGDFVAFYLAMAYGINPATLPIIDELKRDMKSRME